MVSEQEISAAIGGTAYGSDGGKLGTIEAFFADDRTGAPTWVSISTGLFGTRHSVVPVAGATFDDGTLRIPVTLDAVKHAPPMAGEHLDPADEEALRRHYGTTAEIPAAGGMTRSEEQLRIGTERVPATRARLVKYVVTEDVQITVPIRREEIRVEEVPVDAADGDRGGESLEGGTTLGGGLPDEIILHTERPVVTIEVVPVERVRLRTELVEGQETVTEQVQREQIGVDQHAGPEAGPR